MRINPCRSSRRLNKALDKDVVQNLQVSAWQVGRHDDGKIAVSYLGWRVDADHDVPETNNCNAT